MAIERFVGRVALLTGASQGIGLATARRLAQEGCKVILSSRKQENVDEAVKLLKNEGLEVAGLAGNQRRKEDRKRLIDYTCEKYGGIDCLFMSAGVSPHQGNLLTVNENHFNVAFDTNVKANFQFIQEILPVFEKRGRGSIVANATAGVYGVTSYFGTGADLFLYSISKTTLVAMVQHVSRDCFNKHVRVNVVAPGPIDTRFLAGGIDESNFNTYWKVASVNREDPAARVGRSEEIASTVAYLLSEDASYVTGNCIIPAGGFVLNRSL